MRATLASGGLVPGRAKNLGLNNWKKKPTWPNSVCAASGGAAWPISSHDIISLTRAKPRRPPVRRNVGLRLGLLLPFFFSFFSF